MKKDVKVYLVLVVVVIAVIVLIYYIKGNGEGEEKTIKCIAENSVLVVKEGCPACAAQKNILEEYLDEFEIIDCANEPQKCMEFGITHIPTWIIAQEKYEGVHSIEQLKELTGC